MYVEKHRNDCEDFFRGTSIVRSNNYRSVIKTYIKASFEPDTEKIVSLIPSGMIDYIIEDEDFSDNVALYALKRPRPFMPQPVSVFVRRRQ